MSVGGGNAAHVLGGLLSSNTLVSSVNFLNTWEPEFERFKNILEENDYNFAVEFEHGMPTRHGKINKISMNPADVIPGMDWIIISTPAFTHELYLNAIKDHIKEGALVTILVAQGGSDWCLRACLGPELCANINFCTCETLPWACRVSEFGKSGRVLATKGSVQVAALPHGALSYACTTMNALLTVDQIVPGSDEAASGKKKIHPYFEPMASPLVATLMNLNALVHPPLMYGRFCDWTETTKWEEPPELYLGVEERGASAITGCSDDLLAVRNALLAQRPELDLSAVVSLYDAFLAIYGDSVGDPTNIMTCLRTNPGYAGLKIPMKELPAEEGGGFVPNFNMRYYTEDIPYGLVVLKGVAEIVGVVTPTVDTLISWCQEKMGKEYLDAGGRLAGKDLGETRAPQNYGLTTVEDLVRWP
ncbi:unnamed protein product [Heterosigma akashiwo]